MAGYDGMRNYQPIFRERESFSSLSGGSLVGDLRQQQVLGGKIGERCPEASALASGGLCFPDRLNNSFTTSTSRPPSVRQERGRMEDTGGNGRI